MSRAGFKPAIPATKRPQTYALDRAATRIGPENYISGQFSLQELQGNLLEMLSTCYYKQRHVPLKCFSPKISYYSGILHYIHFSNVSVSYLYMLQWFACIPPSECLSVTCFLVLDLTFVIKLKQLLTGIITVRCWRRKEHVFSDIGEMRHTGCHNRSVIKNVRWPRKTRATRWLTSLIQEGSSERRKSECVDTVPNE
jgi:hypothetical protein